MPHVVTQSCCSDASCVVACPVNCIHPAPGEPGFAEAEMVYVDPESCVDCGACVTACPVGAIVPHTKLTERQLPFIALNSSYFMDEPHADRTPLALVPTRRVVQADDVRIAVVGAGPAAMYAADELLKNPGVKVDVFDRLPTPYGLVRAGVAPDHQDTKLVTKLFRAIEEQPGFRYVLNVEIGRDLSHDDLARSYHGVVYAVGASADRALGVPGEDLAGSVSATDVVGWYNGHPDHGETYVDLGERRIVVVGNGNVALDVARILTADPETLAGTDIADLPLATLRGSAVQEVLVLGRRGPAEAAFTMPELIGLAGRDDVDVLVDNGGEEIVVDSPKTALIAELSRRRPTPGRRRIVLRFRTAPVAVVGDGSVQAIEVVRTDLRPDADGVPRAVPMGETEVIPCAMVLRSVGYRGRPVDGLPFDDATGTVPNDGGRVRPGVYVAGWIKRGPTGYIGTNKACAEETVTGLLDDLEHGHLTEPTVPVERLLMSLEGKVVDRSGWRRIDDTERGRGAERARPRVKIVDLPDLVAVARPPMTQTGREHRGLPIRQSTKRQTSRSRTPT
ncbi:FAD-dependent oxidoreductase [Nocardioides sp. Root151]|uniref:FAD-dependent oxidoreductase n=1 Tax=Nocardioides sp. Root151 TaxID=1736475 RepID=UPI0007024704|nr:FAD-dependent oxidoreductase [Nocardioides sp. Root151]KQZ66329.1 4Fe-4S ferredoxin [Nocardioides sp. Root151]